MSRPEWESFTSSDEIERSDGSMGRYWAKVVEKSVERIFRRVLIGKWRGREMVVEPMDQSLAKIYHDEFPEWARSNGMAGDQYVGFSKVVDLSEVTDVRIIEHDEPIG